MALLTLPLAAQSASTTAPAAGESISLEEFNVTAVKTSGYRATNSITATGIGAAISEVPIAISTVTNQFISDTVGLELRDALNYVPGVVTNPRSESTFVVRGFSGLIGYRNGQYRRQLFPTWNIDRVEVVKGPAAIFFGAVRPGGIINYVTMKPEFGTTFTEVKVTAGNEDFYRGELFHNQALSDDLAVRVGLGGFDVKGERQFEYKRENYAGLSLSWKPTANQQLTVDLETINRAAFYLSSYDYRALSNSRYLYNSAVPAANQATTAAASNVRSWLNANGYASVPTFDVFAPIFPGSDPYGFATSLTNDAEQKQKSRTVDIDYLVKFSDRVVWQTSLNYAYDDTRGIQISDGETRPYANGTIRFRTENFINVRDSYNLDNKITWRFDLGPTQHTLQVGQEYQWVKFNRPGYIDASNRYNESVGNNNSAPYVTGYRPGIDAPVSVKALNAASGQSFNIERDDVSEAQGYFVANQSKLFDGRANLLYGARYNKFGGSRRWNRPVANSSLSSTTASKLIDYDLVAGKGGWTPQVGGLVTVVEGVGAFATYSQSIEANTAVDADGNGSEPIESESFDAGVKFDLIHGRLASTFAYYTITRGNIAYTDTARQTATGRSPYYIFGNEEASEGVELELNYTPFDNYQVMAGWSHFLKAEVTKSNTAANVGQPLAYTPENTFNLWNRYEFTSGALKGVILGGGLRHNDAARISSDPNIVVKADAFTIYDLMAGYKFTVFTRPVTAQANVKNVADKRYREGSDGFFGAARTYTLSFQTRF